ncbi:MAG: SpoIIE family protein phosphatase [Streptosporangiales bacterium]|nr:SpoIIE family protein phosphatase [Streptosporangiales bacterium]
MTGDLFAAVTRVISEPMLLIDLSGEVVAFNAVARRTFTGVVPEASVYDLVTNPKQDVHDQLHRWRRTFDPSVGTLTFTGPDGVRVRCRCYGGRADWMAAGRPAVQVRAIPVDGRDRFVQLNDRFTRESRLRRRAEGERDLSLLQEQRTRERLVRLHTLGSALALASSLREVAEVVMGTVPVATEAMGAVLGLRPEPILPEAAWPGPAGTWDLEPWIDLDRPEARALAEVTRPTTIGIPERPLGRFAPALADIDHVALCRPVWSGGEPIGVLALAVPPGSSLSPHDEHLASVALQVGQALARAGMFEREHRLALRLQRSLLPDDPGADGLDAAARYAPGSALTEVGGDFYDLFELPGGPVALVIGDVAGHGLPEASVMSELRSALRAIAIGLGEQPPEVLSELARYVDRYLPAALATVCYLVYDRETRRLLYTNAGHVPPLIVRAGGGTELLRGALEPPLGAPWDQGYASAEAVVEPGDTLLLYTDGVVERRDEALDAGIERLRRDAAVAPGLTVEELCDVLVTDKLSTAYPDDRAILTLRFP